MKQNITLKRKRLTAYLAAGVGAGAAVQQSEAITIVTSYGPGAQSPSTIPATPLGIEISQQGSHNRKAGGGITGVYFAFGSSGEYFNRGTDLTVANDGRYATYFNITGGNVFARGAVGGDQNFANISFNGNDDIYEAVAQFSFDGLGNGYLVAIAQNDDFAGLSITDGVAAIASGGAAMPEHSSSLGLLAMGVAGLLVLRRKTAS